MSFRWGVVGGAGRGSAPAPSRLLGARRSGNSLFPPKPGDAEPRGKTAPARYRSEHGRPGPDEGVTCGAQSSSARASPEAPAGSRPSFGRDLPVAGGSRVVLPFAGGRGAEDPGGAARPGWRGPGRDAFRARSPEAPALPGGARQWWRAWVMLRGGQRVGWREGTGVSSPGVAPRRVTSGVLGRGLAWRAVGRRRVGREVIPTPTLRPADAWRCPRPRIPPERERRTRPTPAPGLAPRRVGVTSYCRRVDRAGVRKWRGT